MILPTRPFNPRPRVTASFRIIKTPPLHWNAVPSIHTGISHLGLILQPFMVNGDISIWVKLSWYDNDWFQKLYNPPPPSDKRLYWAYTWGSNFATLHSQWWHLYMSEIFLSRSKTTNHILPGVWPETPFTCVKDIVHTEVKITAWLTL